jgi:hypothetical protein
MVAQLKIIIYITHHISPVQHYAPNTANSAFGQLHSKSLSDVAAIRFFIALNHTVIHIAVGSYYSPVFTFTRGATTGQSLTITTSFATDTICDSNWA